MLAHVVPGGPASSLAASQLLSSAVDRWPERFTDQVATGPDDVLSAGRRELLASRTWTRAVAAAESPRDKTVFASAGSSETSAPLRISQTRSPILTSPTGSSSAEAENDRVNGRPREIVAQDRGTQGTADLMLMYPALRVLAT